jgi:hypothetical protein
MAVVPEGGVEDDNVVTFSGKFIEVLLREESRRVENSTF